MFCIYMWQGMVLCIYKIANAAVHVVYIFRVPCLNSVDNDDDDLCKMCEWFCMHSQLTLIRLVDVDLVDLLYLAPSVVTLRYWHP